MKSEESLPPPPPPPPPPRTLHIAPPIIVTSDDAIIASIIIVALSYLAQYSVTRGRRRRQAVKCNFASLFFAKSATIPGLILLDRPVVERVASVQRSRRAGSSMSDAGVTCRNTTVRGLRGEEREEEDDCQILSRTLLDTHRHTTGTLSQRREVKVRCSET